MNETVDTLQALFFVLFFFILQNKIVTDKTLIFFFLHFLLYTVRETTAVSFCYLTIHKNENKKTLRLHSNSTERHYAYHYTYNNL